MRQWWLFFSYSALYLPPLSSTEDYRSQESQKNKHSFFVQVLKNRLWWDLLQIHSGFGHGSRCCTKATYRTEAFSGIIGSCVRVQVTTRRSALDVGARYKKKSHAEDSLDYMINFGLPPKD